MYRDKIKYILSCKIQEMFLFSHLCCATERPNIFRVAAGTHHWIVKTNKKPKKKIKQQEITENKNKENNSPTAQAAIFVCAFQLFFLFVDCLIPYQDSK